MKNNKTQLIWNLAKEEQAFLYKQNFYKQRQAEIGRKLRNTLRLNFWQTCRKNKFFVSFFCILLWGYMINCNEMKMIMEKRLHE